MSFTETLQSITGKLLADCTDQELYLALLELVRQKSADRVQPVILCNVSVKLIKASSFARVYLKSRKFSLFRCFQIHLTENRFDICTSRYTT